MALIMSDQNVNLTPQELKPVHPFFGKDRHAPDRGRPQPDITFDTQQQQTTPTQQYLNTVLNDTLTDQAATHIPSNQSNASPTPLPPTSPDVGLVQENVTSLAVDLNEERKKRRKIDGDALLDPARAQGPKDQISQPSSHQQVGLTQSWKSQLEEAASAYAVEAPKTQAEGPTLAEDEVNANVPSGAPPSKSETPKKKWLKLNSRGTLGSPVHEKTKPGKSRSSANPSPKKRKTSGRHSLKVVIRYGSNTENRISVGQRITDILSGKHMSSEADTRGPASPAKKAEPSRPLEPQKPPKTTHPFFLSKPGKKLDPPIEETAEVMSKPARTSGGLLPSNASDTDGSIIRSPKRSQVGLRWSHKPSNASKSSMGIFSASSASTIMKYPGAIDAPWPGKGMAHIRSIDTGGDRGYPTVATHHDATIQSNLVTSEKKLKNAMIFVPKEEDLLYSIAKHFDIPQDSQALHESHPSQIIDYAVLPESLRVPARRITTGTGIQAHVRRELTATLSLDGTDSEDELQFTEKSPIQTHPAILHLYKRISTSLTAFDQGRCEMQAWAQKYAPKSSSEVLQSGREAIILKDWLESLTVRSIETTSTATKRASSKDRARKKKKRKTRGEGLDDFIISSDEEADDMHELTDPDDSATVSSLLKRTVIRAGDAANTSGRMTNAVVISGPVGCGKTAAVFAVAHELGFEVFEINSGSRRSGKDLLERVGDMTRNHLVHRAKEDSGASSADEDLLKAAEVIQEEISSGKQGTMDSFFKSQGAKPKSKPAVKAKQSGTRKDPSNNDQQHQVSKQKQSLILLEEVDVLFEEDKQFWSTVLSLIAQSKRPVIMTCNDESLLPLDELSLHAILRFSAPPKSLVADYLLVMAGAEGHLLEREAIESLYISKKYDLRASIAELQFWCQMGIGDRKGGLEWILDRWPKGSDFNEHGEQLRVTSTGSYRFGMGWLSNDGLPSGKKETMSAEDQLLTEAWDNWGLDMEDWCEDTAFKSVLSDMEFEIMSSDSRYKALASIDLYFDALSASDIWAVPGFRTNNDIPMDPTQPELASKTASNYTEGQPLLQTDELTDYSRSGLHMALSTQTGAKRALSQQLTQLKSTKPLSPLSEIHVNKMIIHAKDAYPHLTYADLSNAFAPIAAPPQYISGQTSAQSVQATTFDRPLSIVMTDIAPYVRSIVAFDVALEKRRLELSNLLSNGRGRDGGRARTTRASRSALEGGDRKTTRREKWFPEKTNVQSVLATAGEGWLEAAAAAAEKAAVDARKGTIEAIWAQGPPAEAEVEDTEMKRTE